MRSVLFILSALLISSCSLVNDSDSGNTQSLIPLQVGNSWAMNVELSSKTEEGTVTVIRDTLIDGQVWYELKGDNYHLEMFYNGIYTNHKDGVYKYSGSEIVSENILLFKRTNQVGESYLNDTGLTKWLTVYDGKNEADNSGVTTKVYTVEFEYISAGSKTYTFDKVYQFKRVISPKTGFVSWESAFMTPLNDTVLTMAQNSQINILTEEFIPAE